LLPSRYALKAATPNAGVPTNSGKFVISLPIFTKSIRMQILQELNFVILEHCSFPAVRIRDHGEVANGALEDSDYDIF
jgi:hypothetical protein